MIKTKEKAREIQERRFNQNKRGYAKAVRRYFKNTDPQNYKTVIKTLKSLSI